VEADGRSPVHSRAVVDPFRTAVRFALAVAVAVAALVVGLASAAGAPVAASAPRAAGHLDAPSKPPPDGPPMNGHKSANWAGYEGTSGKAGTFTDVQASWKVPSAACGSTPTNASIWVGLGTGQASSPLIQTGVAVNCASGLPQYLAWWEEYPVNLEQDYGDPVSPGDLMVADVSWQSGTATLTLTDDGPAGLTQWSEVTRVEGAPTSASAQCIVERPLVGGVLGALTNFGKVAVSGCDVTIVTKKGPTSGALPNGSGLPKVKVTPITMVGTKKNTLVIVSTVKGAGDGAFTGTWVAST
jgi:Peptidase A4 family